MCSVVVFRVSSPFRNQMANEPDPMIVPANIVLGLADPGPPFPVATEAGEIKRDVRKGDERQRPN